MTVTTNERGQQNLFAKEPQMYVSKSDAERYGYETYAEKAEKLNGRTAMIGFFFAVFSYALTGNLFFGMLWWQRLSLPQLASHSLYCFAILLKTLLKPIDGKLSSWNSNLLCNWRCPSNWCSRSIFLHCIHACPSKYKGTHGRLQGSQNIRWFLNLWELTFRYK